MDDRLKLEAYAPKSDTEKLKIEELTQSCLLNLSACYLKTKEWASCLKATSFVLEKVNNFNI